MREIKFRVWDKANRTMAFGGSFRDIYPTMNREEWSYVIDTPHPDDCELMQYTGLKDKNGVEIYEGDIVAMEGSTEQGLYGEVVWFNDNSCFGWFSRRFPDDMLRGFANKNRIEVIGNIWENPELLEANND